MAIFSDLGRLGRKFPEHFLEEARGLRIEALR